MQDQNNTVITPVPETPPQGVSVGVIHDDQLVSNYAGNQDIYAFNSLEGDAAPADPVKEMFRPRFVFSRRKAMIVSLVVTLVVLVLTTAIMTFVIRHDPTAKDAQTQKQQDVSLTN